MPEAAVFSEQGLRDALLDVKARANALADQSLMSACATLWRSEPSMRADAFAVIAAFEDMGASVAALRAVLGEQSSGLRLVTPAPAPHDFELPNTDQPQGGA